MGVVQGAQDGRMREDVEREQMQVRVAASGGGV